MISRSFCVLLTILNTLSLCAVSDLSLRVAKYNKTVPFSSQIWLDSEGNSPLLDKLQEWVDEENAAAQREVCFLDIQLPFVHVRKRDEAGVRSLDSVDLILASIFGVARVDTRKSERTRAKYDKDPIFTQRPSKDEQYVRLGAYVKKCCQHIRQRLSDYFSSMPVPYS